MHRLPGTCRQSEVHPTWQRPDQSLIGAEACLLDDRIHFAEPVHRRATSTGRDCNHAFRNVVNLPG
jgi:hypothetical protein